MLSDDVFRSRLMATIESIRYFVPSIADVAHCEEQSDSAYWKVAVAPRTPGACPVELILHSTQRYDIMVAGEAYEDRQIVSLDVFVPLIMAISEACVIERSWYSLGTGSRVARETLVTLPAGKKWTDSSGLSLIAGIEDTLRHEDRHFLPYRREHRA